MQRNSQQPQQQQQLFNDDDFFNFFQNEQQQAPSQPLPQQHQRQQFNLLVNSALQQSNFDGSSIFNNVSHQRQQQQQQAPLTSNSRNWSSNSFNFLDSPGRNSPVRQFPQQQLSPQQIPPQPQQQQHMSQMRSVFQQQPQQQLQPQPQLQQPQQPTTLKVNVKFCELDGKLVETCRRDKKYQIMVETVNGSNFSDNNRIRFTLFGLTSLCTSTTDSILLRLCEKIMQQFSSDRKLATTEMKKSGCIPIHCIEFDKNGKLGNSSDSAVYPTILKNEDTNDNVWSVERVYNATPVKKLVFYTTFKVSSNDNGSLLHKFQKGYVVLVQGSGIHASLSTRIQQVAKNLKRTYSDQIAPVITSGPFLEQESDKVLPFKRPRSSASNSDMHMSDNEDEEPNTPDTIGNNWVRIKILHTAKNNTIQVNCECPLTIKNLQSLTIGRSPSCDFCIHDSFMSRQHFRIEFQLNQMRAITHMKLVPLGKNTILKRTTDADWRLVTSDIMVSVGDQILVGMTKLKIIDITQDDS
jgi:hypothetical protein